MGPKPAMKRTFNFALSFMASPVRGMKAAMPTAPIHANNPLRVTKLRSIASKLVRDRWPVLNKSDNRSVHAAEGIKTVSVHPAKRSASRVMCAGHILFVVIVVGVHVICHYVQ